MNRLHKTRPHVKHNQFSSPIGQEKEEAIAVPVDGVGELPYSDLRRPTTIAGGFLSSIILSFDDDDDTVNNALLLCCS